MHGLGGSLVLGAKVGSGEVTITITGFSDQPGEELLTRSQHCHGAAGYGTRVFEKADKQFLTSGYGCKSFLRNFSIK